MSGVLMALSVPAVFLLMYTAEELNERRPMVRVRSWKGYMFIASAMVLMMDTSMWAYYLLWSSVW